MDDRIEIVSGDILKCMDIVANADVVIMNNVFDAFVAKEELDPLWKAILSALKKGAQLVTYPTLASSLTNGQMSDEDRNSLLERFVEIEIDKSELSQEMIEEIDMYSLYEVVQ